MNNTPDTQNINYETKRLTHKNLTTLGFSIIQETTTSKPVNNISK